MTKAAVAKGSAAMAKRKPTKAQRERRLTLATAERRQHDVIERGQTDQTSRGAVIERVATHRVIDRLLRQRRISQRQYDAADRLLRTWWRGKVLAGTPKVVDLSEYTGADGGGLHDPEALSQARAQDEYRRALAALTPSQRHAVEMVVIWDHALRWYGTLERGLDALAQHYRL